MNCIECQELILGDGKKFCSRSCAAKSGHRTRKESGWTLSVESRKRTSEALKGRPAPSKGSERVPRYNLVCNNCGNCFRDTNKDKKYCKMECCLKNAGGYREGSGRSKSGYFRGIYSGSTYELVWMIYRLDNGLEVKRFNGFLEGDGIKYIPDFIIDNTIIEIKGFEDSGSVAKKTQLAESRGYEVKVLYKEDLRTEFDWVKQNYEYKNLHELYDGYKPKYNLMCGFCEIEFLSDSNKRIMCSRSCAGKYRARIKHQINVP